MNMGYSSNDVVDEHIIYSIFPMIWFTLNNKEDNNNFKLKSVVDSHKVWNELHQYSSNKTLDLVNSITIADNFKINNNIDKLQISFIIDERYTNYENMMNMSNSEYLSCKLPKLIESIKDNKFGLPIGIKFLNMSDKAFNKSRYIRYMSVSGISELHLLFDNTYVLVENEEDFNNRLNNNIAVRNLVLSSYDHKSTHSELNTLSLFNNF